MKEILVIFAIFFLFTSVSAIKITEFESNPSGTDSGKEWIELYSSSEIDLEGYKLINYDGDEIELSGNFSNYYVYEFEKQWLDNKDEKVLLYKNGKVIDQTKIFKDEQNDERSWQLCDDWVFADSTEQEDNDCGVEEPPEEDIVEEEEEPIEEEPEEEEPEEERTEGDVIEIMGVETDSQDKIVITAEVINLNPKDIKSDEDNESLSIEDYALYGFIIFFIVIIILFVLKKNKFKKNEFA
ncbi:lamin tail domain-containing protein [Nanoarchaeota archaeon]